MNPTESKSLAVLRVLQIFQQYSDYDHPLTQEAIANYLEQDYGITLERKAIARSISRLKEAAFPIESRRAGSWLSSRTFEDAELHMLIDGVLCSRYMTAKQSKDLIERLCSLSSRYFRSHIKNIHTVSERSKTENPSVFYAIELIDEAIEKHKQVQLTYSKFGADKKLHKSSSQAVTPYQLVLHNQRYYLMALNEYWRNIVYLRLDHITEITLKDEPATPLKSIPGYEHGINYRALSTALPYMFTDKPEQVCLLADAGIIDQIVDWFGENARFVPIKEDGQHIYVYLTASLKAMEHWAIQYSTYVTVVSPAALRERIRLTLSEAMKRYET